MKLLTTKVTYRVPNGSLCNLATNSKKNQVSKEHCRFCVKVPHGYTCVLYNKALKTCGDSIEKYPLCNRASFRTESNNVDSDVAQYSSVTSEKTGKSTVQPVVTAIRTSIKLFCKTYQDLRQQGITELLALKVTEQMLLDGKDKQK